MEDKQKPEYTGSLDVALWKKVDKNGKEYFTMKINNICNVCKSSSVTKDQSP